MPSVSYYKSILLKYVDEALDVVVYDSVDNVLPIDAEVTDDCTVLVVFDRSTNHVSPEFIDSCTCGGQSYNDYDASSSPYDSEECVGITELTDYFLPDYI